MTRFSRHNRGALVVLAAVVLAACASGQATPSTRPVATTIGLDSTTSTAPATSTTVAAPIATSITTINSADLPAAQLQAITDTIPASLHVPGVVVAVSAGGNIWAGAAGIEDTAAGAAMRTDRRFRAASITKLFTARVIFGMVERGELGFDDTLAEWFPTFPNAERITIGMLLSHTGGVTTDWWLQPDLLQLATTNLEREWSPHEIIDLMTERPPADEPGRAVQYSNLNYILLGEIAATLGHAPIGTLIDDQILQPLRLDHTTYQFDNAPDLAHAYNSFTGQTLDVGALSLRSFTSMAGSAGALQTDAGDLVRYVREMFRPGGLLSPETITAMEQTTPTSGRHGMATMGFCPCTDTTDGRQYSGWGHTGSIPGFFSATAYFPSSDTAIAMFVNSDTADGKILTDDALDNAIAQLITTTAGR